MNNSIYEFDSVDSGIGQGTILGPIMYILFVNDLISLISPENSIKMYADDVKLYGPSKTETNRRVIQENLDRISVHLDTWQIKVNPEKCEVMHLGYSNFSADYNVNGSLLESKPLCRDLGIYISEDLKVRNHCSLISRSSYYKLRQFSLAFECKDIDFQLCIYSTYIRPLLEHNTQIWSPYQLGDIDTIERVQKLFTRKLPGLRNYPYMERLQILQMKTLEERRIMNDVILLYKIIYKMIDMDAEKFFTFNRNPTRGHSLKINTQHSRLNCRKFFFFNRTIPIWNALSEETVSSTSLGIFKAKLKATNLAIYCRGRAHMAI